MAAEGSGYDFIIVGGGSAGCSLASRLSEDRGNRVLVLEAGRPDYRWDVFIHMPAALTFPIGSRFYDWKYESEPEPYMNDRRIYHARGKVLGGSSSINGMIFQRGNPLDYVSDYFRPGRYKIRIRFRQPSGCIYMSQRTVGWSSVRLPGARR
jgi:choline dehydrogenase-like flavoprotein